MASKRVAQIAAHLNYPKGMFNGQTAIITGSGQGIGAEAARLFANEGAKVVIADIDAGTLKLARSRRASPNDTLAEKSKTVAESINKSGGQALAVAGDILNDEYITDLVKKSAEFGGGKIHIIVNNAGFTWDGVIHRVSQARSAPCPDCMLIDGR